MGRLHIAFGALLILLVIHTAGCNKGAPPADPKNTGPNADSKAKMDVAQNEQRWPTRAAMLAAAPAEKLVTKEVKVGEETYLLEVPANSKITTPDNDTIIQVEIGPEKQYGIRWAPDDITFFKKLEAQNGANEFLYLDDETLVARKGDGTINANMNLADAYRNFGVRIGGVWKGKNWTEQDFMLALKSAVTLRVKNAYETDPLAVAKRLKVNLSGGAPAEVNEASFPTETTPNTLKLLAAFPNLEGVSFESTAGFNESASLPGLTRLTKLRKLSFDTGSFPSTEISRQWLGEIAQLSNLEKLELKWCLKTSGELESLGKLAELRSLDFRTNQEALNGVGALAGLKKLKNLTIKFESDDVPPILGDLLVALAKLPELETLELVGGINGMVDADLSKVAALPKLNELKWDSNALQATASPQLGNSPLETLDLSRSGNHGKITADFIAGLPTRLKTLRLSRATLDDAAAAELAKLPTLDRLNVSDCKIGKSALAKIAESKTLKTIWNGSSTDDSMKKDLQNLQKAKPKLDITP